jgi:Holliday junction resolvase-like predicted endonuclease
METETKTESLTYEKVWAMFQETDRQFKETALRFKETDHQFKETDRQFKELASLSIETKNMFKETDRKMKQLQELFEGQWSKLVESLIEGDLIRLLRERGVDVNETFTRVKKNHNNSIYEIDILAANGNEVVAVEVKTTLKIKKVRHYLSKLNKFKEVFPIYKEHKIFGAMAYIREDEQSGDYAEKQGLFVIKGTGKSSSITNGLEFIPRLF